MGNTTISAIPESELAKFEAPVPYAEFPKWKYHPDGRSQLVSGEREDSELGPEWLPNPTEALAERDRRDEASLKAFAAKGAKAAKGE